MILNELSLSCNCSPDTMQRYDLEIKEAVDCYVSEVFQDDEQRTHDNFNKLLLHLNNTVIGRSAGTVPTRDQLPVYEYLFQVYISLCVRFNVLPSIGMYAIFTGISPLVIDQIVHNTGHYTSRSWMTESDKSYLFTMISNMQGYCKAMTIDRLHNMRGSDANLIFISKAAYGLTETAPVQTVEYRQTSSLEAIADSIGIDVTDG